MNLTAKRLAQTDPDSSRHVIRELGAGLRESLLLMADSTGQRNGFIELLCWRLVAKGLPWALIQLSSHGVELGL